MNRITYLSHSGFAVLTTEAILVFDYLRDPAHALDKILAENPDLPVVFLVTHRHKDHFNPHIFQLAQNHKRVYVMSNDVPASIIPSTLQVAGMSRGDIIDNVAGAGITVKAYGSTDEGVSYLVTTRAGERLFHAGDLNDWHWADESTVREAEKAHAEFRTLVDRIAAEVPQVDVAFFPVDVRLHTDYAAGARYFLEKVVVRDFFPMHFNGDWREACDFPAYVPSRTSAHCLREPGQSIALGKI